VKEAALALGCRCCSRPRCATAGEGEAGVPGRAVAAGGFHGGEGVQGVQAGGDAGELGGVFLGGGDEDVVVAGRVDRTHGAGREPAQGGEGQQAGGLHLEVLDSLRREAGDDVGLARHEAGDLAALGAVEAGGGGGDADVVAVAVRRRRRRRGRARPAGRRRRGSPRRRSSGWCSRGAGRRWRSRGRRAACRAGGRRRCRSGS
jgi:hypothetical protein